MVNYWVWMRRWSFHIALRGFPESIRGVREQGWSRAWLKWTRGIIFLCWSEYLSLCVCVCMYTVFKCFEHPKDTKARFHQYYFLFSQSETLPLESWKICSISWVNLHLAVLALCQLIWTEKRGLPRQRMLLILFSFIWTDLLWLRAPCFIILFWRGAGHCLLPKYLSD